MTADGTYPSPRAGETPPVIDAAFRRRAEAQHQAIFFPDDQHTPRAGEAVSTAAELDALPVGSVVVEGDHTTPDEEGPFGITTIPGVFHRFPDGWYVVAGYGARAPEEMLPVSVLFRPDAPQPATTDEVVERAARAAWEAAYPEPERAHHAWDSPIVRETWTDIARAALAAAGAGEAEPSPLCECGEPKDGHSHPSGEAVDREALLDALSTTEVHHPDQCDCNLDGERCDGIEAQADRVLALLAARGDAAPNWRCSGCQHPLPPQIGVPGKWDRCTICGCEDFEEVRD